MLLCAEIIVKLGVLVGTSSTTVLKDLIRAIRTIWVLFSIGVLLLTITVVGYRDVLTEVLALEPVFADLLSVLWVLSHISTTRCEDLVRFVRTVLVFLGILEGFHAITKFV